MLGFADALGERREGGLGGGQLAFGLGHGQGIVYAGITSHAGEIDAFLLAFDVVHHDGLFVLQAAQFQISGGDLGQQDDQHISPGFFIRFRARLGGLNALADASKDIEFPACRQGAGEIIRGITAGETAGLRAFAGFDAHGSSFCAQLRPELAGRRAAPGHRLGDPRFGDHQIAIPLQGVIDQGIERGIAKSCPPGGEGRLGVAAGVIGGETVWDGDPWLDGGRG